MSTAASGTVVTCPTCAEPVAASDEFCEACGRRLGAPPVLATTGSPTAVSATAAAPCTNCQASASHIDPEGYCDLCGHLQPRGTDHVEVDVGSAVAVSDRGHRHRRNEDAVGVASGPGWVVAVVCDGVSTTANPDLASGVAASVCTSTLAGAFANGVPDGIPALLRQAVAAAQAATADVEQVERGGYPGAPSTTLVAAVVTEQAITTANIGDSRAYWIAGDGSHQISTDDSWAESAIAAGMDRDSAYRDPQAHVITAWLGADGVTTFEPVERARLGGSAPNQVEAPISDCHVVTWTPSGAGTLILCSDGLWNYYPELSDLVALVGDGTEPALALAARLVAAACAAGGADNVSVAIVPVPLPGSSQRCGNQVERSDGEEGPVLDHRPEGDSR